MYSFILILDTLFQGFQSSSKVILHLHILLQMNFVFAGWFSISQDHFAIIHLLWMFHFGHILTLFMNHLISISSYCLKPSHIFESIQLSLCAYCLLTRLDIEYGLSVCGLYLDMIEFMEIKSWNGWLFWIFTSPVQVHVSEGSCIWIWVSCKAQSYMSSTGNHFGKCQLCNKYIEEFYGLQNASVWKESFCP